MDSALPPLGGEDPAFLPMSAAGVEALALPLLAAAGTIAMDVGPASHTVASGAPSDGGTALPPRLLTLSGLLPSL